MELAFRARLPGHTHLQLHELNSSLTRTPKSPVGALPQIPWTTSTLTRVHRSSAGRPPYQVQVPARRLGSGNPDMDQTTALHTRSGHAPPRADPPDVSLANLRIRQPRRHRVGPRGTHYNQTRGSLVPAAPLWIERRPGPLTRIRTTIDNPLTRSLERTSGSAGTPSQVPMRITRYLRAKTQAAAHLMTRIPTLE